MYFFIVKVKLGKRSEVEAFTQITRQDKREEKDLGNNKEMDRIGCLGLPTLHANYSN